MAVDRLREIRYQQTISGSSTGTAKMPVGLEATFVSGRSYVQQQMSLPEIVASLRNFLELVSEKRRVVIGVDELDKIGSGEKAIRFLNEIKGIFGIKKVFFLVSVSEDAMAGFERRGLPFRDAFDSSFDEIVRVEPLTLAESAALLRRRLFGMPAPFKQFCHCQSGGLPRDLIRSARSVVSVCRSVASASDTQTPATLEAVVSETVRLDLAGKVSAAMVVGRQPSCEPLTAELLAWCDGVRQAAHDAQRLLNHISRLGSPEIASAAALVRDRPAYADLEALTIELSCYCYYSATVLEFFRSTASQSRWRADEIGLSASDLVRARAYFLASHVLAWEKISDFRSRLSLEVIGMPNWLRRSTDSQTVELDTTRPLGGVDWLDNRIR